MSEQNGSVKSPAKVVARNMAEVAHDAIKLAELQVALLKMELRDFLRAAATPVVLLLFSFLLILGCIPVVLLGLAYMLVDFAGLSPALATCSVGAIGVVGAGLAAVWGAQKLRAVALALERSRGEFQRNLDWVKHILKFSSGIAGRGAQPTARFHRQETTME